MPATASDFPNTSWKNVSEPVSSAPGDGKIGFSGSPVDAAGNVAGIGEGLFRLAGGLGQLFGSSPALDEIIKETTKQLNEMRRQYTRQTNRRIENIAGLTGLSPEDAMSQYYENFANTASTVKQAGLANLGISPDISTEYDRLNTRVQDIQDQYSLAGRLGGYEKLALDPPVVSMKLRGPGGVQEVIDYVEPGGSAIAPKYQAYFSYLDNPQTQQFIYGSRNTADAIGKYYNTSGDVAGLMNYGGIA